MSSDLAGCMYCGYIKSSLTQLEPKAKDNLAKKQRNLKSHANFDWHQLDAGTSNTFSPGPAVLKHTLQKHSLTGARATRGSDLHLAPLNEYVILTSTVRAKRKECRCNSVEKECLRLSTLGRVYRKASSRSQPDIESYHGSCGRNRLIGTQYDDRHILSHGVKQAKAVAAAWTKTALVGAYVGIFLVFFVLSLQQQITGNLTAYVTSAFSKHTLLATTTVISSIISAAVRLPVAKIMDIWGRVEGYLLMVSCCTLGLVMMASCNSVEMYAAAQVFYWVGHNGMAYVLDIFLADTSSLKNRGWLFAFSTSPYIATTFAGPAAAHAFYRFSSWRWAFGTFSIVLPLASAPVAGIFFQSRRKAMELGYLAKKRSGRTLIQSVKHYFAEFDVIGMILLIAAFALILLPFSISTYQSANWKSPAVISMLVIGGCSLAAFVLWERFGARNGRRSVFGYRNRVSQFLVVHRQTIQNAGYIGNIYSIGTCVWSLATGAIIRATGRFKYLALAAIPLQMMGVSLMIRFQKPGTDIGFIILCQVLIALSGGTMVICEQIAIMAAVSHGEVAVALALLGLFSSVGSAIGQTIAGAIWTHTIPQYLQMYLPESAKWKAMEIYDSLEEQLSYPMDSPERQAIMSAYEVGQRRMLIVGLCVLPLAMVWILMWRDIQLKNVKRAKGTVF
uniref:Siderophore iron transporter mirB n=1 Tax=Coccidioides posadasii RMSCC 3488 TaxID=454284 RepID=A0A0J6FC19_COCPO|nr:siderophore iron transporter mirB [Coccidioides posadasii RMSCC 3488]